MTEKTINKVIDFLKDVANSGCKSIREYCNIHNLDSSNWYTRIANVCKALDIDPTKLDTITKLKSDIKNNEAQKEEFIDTDARAETKLVRDDSGKIQYYKFEIYRRDKTPVVGTLTREEMNNVYRLYSYYGASITQREISRTLPEYSLVDFKHILRAFNITKACAPFAPHMFEEYSEEELKEMHLRLKENNFLKKLEKDEINDLRKLNTNLAKQLNNLKTNIIQNVIDAGIEIKESNFNPKEFKELAQDDRNLIIWLSDMHIGAYNDAFGAYDIDEYNKEDIAHRLNVIIQKFAGRSYENIYVVNLGDSVDSFKKETTRGGHPLPSVWNDKEISMNYIELMKQFFVNLQANTHYTNMTYLCIGESNHDGDTGWLNNKILEAHLQNMGIDTYISNFSIDVFCVGDHTFVYAHGKDNYTQFKNFPLTLNDKTDLYFTQWMNGNNIMGKYKYVVKGDLHRFAYTVGNTFDYISVGSLYGSSNWITANFGNTKWSINFMEIQGNDMQIGTIREQNIIFRQFIRVF